MTISAKHKPLILMIAGLVIFVGFQVASHTLVIPVLQQDLVQGLVFGFVIGLEIMGLLAMQRSRLRR